MRVSTTPLAHKSEGQTDNYVISHVVSWMTTQVEPAEADYKLDPNQESRSRVTVQCWVSKSPRTYDSCGCGQLQLRCSRVLPFKLRVPPGVVTFPQSLALFFIQIILYNLVLSRIRDAPWVVQLLGPKTVQVWVCLSLGIYEFVIVRVQVSLLLDNISINKIF